MTRGFAGGERRWLHRRQPVLRLTRGDGFRRAYYFFISFFLPRRVLVCNVCERAPAAVTCKADAAALCVACDADIHSADPLDRRHERLTVVPFFDAVKPSASVSAAVEEFSEEEVEAASWILPDSNKFGPRSGSPEYKPTEYLFGEADPNLDLDLVGDEVMTRSRQTATWCTTKFRELRER
ncbi:hypothetical protein CASFOL_025388 [Castilleja foliolosa]|uniref:B box-type domain-containing protein n=1 Tax=Castilleja foliolosa TaxID=1961234 RepID=A0ABD3CTH9_9LAMI